MGPKKDGTAAPTRVSYLTSGRALCLLLAPDGSCLLFVLVSNSIRLSNVPPSVRTIHQRKAVVAGRCRVFSCYAGIPRRV